MTHNNKIKFSLGLILILAAFIGVVVLFYFMIDQNRMTQNKMFQMEVQFWLNLQTAYDLWHALKRHQKKLPLKKAG